MSQPESVRREGDLYPFPTQNKTSPSWTARQGIPQAEESFGDMVSPSNFATGDHDRTSSRTASPDSDASSDIENGLEIDTPSIPTSDEADVLDALDLNIAPLPEAETTAASPNQAAFLNPTAYNSISGSQPQGGAIFAHNPSDNLNSLSKEDYPLVAFWDRADFTNADSDLTTISEDDESAKLAFLEHQNGDRFTAQEEADTRAHIRAAFVSLLEKQLAPLTWSQASSIAVNWLRTEMLTYCPDLGLCAMNWKVDALATEVYSQWSCYCRDEIQSHRPAPANTNTNGKHKSGESESSIASKKRKPDSLVSKASTKTTSTKTTKKPTRKPSPTSAPNTAPVAVTSASDTTSPTNSSPAYELPLRIPSPLPPSPDIHVEDQPDPKSAVNTHSDPVPPRILPAATAPVIKIVNPLSGLLGRAPAPHVSRIKDIVPPDSVGNAKTPAPEVEAQGTPVAPLTHQPNASTEAPDVQKKKPPHRPGAAHTAWNLFGREHMKTNPKDMITIVQAAFAALTPERLKHYKDEAARLKQQKKSTTSTD
ncbi:hypothetical protein B0H13DRAFT_2307127 [Mycena leptocephala]|nr:hypothetical protein B0H13DRAFT_2307127 [Mycena leptocephala]